MTATLLDLSRGAEQIDVWRRLAADARLSGRQRAVAQLVVDYCEVTFPLGSAPPPPVPWTDSDGINYGGASPRVWLVHDGVRFEFASILGKWRGVTVWEGAQEISMNTP